MTEAGLYEEIHDYEAMTSKPPTESAAQQLQPLPPLPIPAPAAQQPLPPAGEDYILTTCPAYSTTTTFPKSSTTPVAQRSGERGHANLPTSSEGSYDDTAAKGDAEGQYEPVGV